MGQTDRRNQGSKQNKQQLPQNSLLGDTNQRKRERDVSLTPDEVKRRGQVGWVVGEKRKSLKLCKGRGSMGIGEGGGPSSGHSRLTATPSFLL